MNNCQTQKSPQQILKYCNQRQCYKLTTSITSEHVPQSQYQSNNNEDVWKQITIVMSAMCNLLGNLPKKQHDSKVGVVSQTDSLLFGDEWNKLETTAEFYDWGVENLIQSSCLSRVQKVTEQLFHSLEPCGEISGARGAFNTMSSPNFEMQLMQRKDIENQANQSLQNSSNIDSCRIKGSELHDWQDIDQVLLNIQKLLFDISAATSLQKQEVLAIKRDKLDIDENSLDLLIEPKCSKTLLLQKTVIDASSNAQNSNNIKILHVNPQINETSLSQNQPNEPSTPSTPGKKIGQVEILLDHQSPDNISDKSDRIIISSNSENWFISQNALIGKNSTHPEQYFQLVQDKSLLEDQVCHLNKQIKQYQSSNAYLTAKLETNNNSLQTIKAGYLQQISRQQCEIERLEVTIGELVRTVHEQVKESSQLLLENDQLKIDINNLRQELVSSSTANDQAFDQMQSIRYKLSQQINQLKDTIHEKQIQIQSINQYYQTNVRNMENQILYYKQQMLNYQVLHEKLGDEIVEYKNRIEVLEMRNNDLIAEIELFLEGNLSNKQNNIESAYVRAYSELMTQITEKNSIIAQLSQKIESLSYKPTQNHKLTDKSISTQPRINTHEIKKQFPSTKWQLILANEKLTESQKQITSLNTVINHLKSKTLNQMSQQSMKITISDYENPSFNLQNYIAKLQRIIQRYETIIIDQQDEKRELYDQICLIVKEKQQLRKSINNDKISVCY